LLFFHRYKFYRREPLQIELSCGKLTQQFGVEAWNRVESNYLNFIRTRLPQDLMVASRAHLSNLLTRVAREQNCEVGRSIVLPSTFRGGQMQMNTMYRHCIESLRVSVVF
jgi:Helitron helicase-like domain at N-terminus